MRPQFRGGIQALSGLLILSVACAVGCNGCGSSSSSSGGTTGTTGSTGTTGTTGTTGSGGNPPPAGVQVLTYHDDNTREGQNTQETVLTPTNVTSSTFGKVGFYSADGKVDAEPLYLPGVMIGGASHNVLYVVTEHDSAYAFDADSGTVLWHVSTLGTGETTRVAAR